MALRVTRQNVEALGPGDGKLRVTRQNVEALGPGDGKLRVTRQNVNVLGSNTGKVRVTRQFVEVLRDAPYFDYLIDLLPLMHSVIVVGIRSYSAEDNLIDDRPGWDDAGNYYTQHFGLGDTLNCQYINNPEKIEYLPINDQVVLIHVKAAGTSLSATDTITFSESANITDEDILTITDSVILEICIPFYDNLEIIDSVDLEIIAVPTEIDNLIINHSVVCVQIKNNTYCTYSPFIGTSSDSSAPHPPRLTPPTIVTYDNLELTYPLIGPTSTLTLRGPELGNKDQLHFQRINRETRGGTLVVFADPVWPKIQTMIVEFYALTETESQNILTFISDSLGKQIGIRDWEGRKWSGIIVSAQNPLTREGLNKNRLSLEINVETLLDNPIVEDILTITHTVAHVIV